MNGSFSKVLSFIYVDPQKYKYYLKNNSFSINEKKILKAYLAYKNKDKELVFSLLRNKKFNTSYLEGLRLYFLGLTFNTFGDFRFAIERLEESLNHLNGDWLYYAKAELIMAYCNTHHPLKASELIKEFEKSSPSILYQEHLNSFVLATYYLKTEQYEKSSHFSYYSLDKDDEFAKHFRASTLLNLFQASLCLEKIDECFLLLEKYKTSSGYTVKANYKYMSLLLNFIYKESPIYFYKNDFKDFPELCEQLEVIWLLDQGLKDDAYKVWKKLAKHNSAYAKNFTFKGNKSLFSIALQKVNHIQKLNQDSFPDLHHFKKTEFKIKYILENCSGVITKELFIKLLYNDVADEKNLRKLSRALGKYKKKYGLNIKSVKQSYKIVS
ncbi:MAG: hypothetical protein N4A33_05160 [Bacteriovoracaceae bacterium]|jgi:hypothetical protein|nr:hypothetical protein [Bacteriovoracaceae bacterium]